MNPTPTVLKASLRSSIRAELKGISSEERVRASARACGLLREQTVWQRAKSVFFYVPLRDELNLLPLAEEGRAEGKLIALPRFDARENAYGAAKLEGSLTGLAQGRFGVLEPPEAAPGVPLNHLDLLLVPGLGFDACGRRLGRGGGFYDRLLAASGGAKCGVAFDLQVRAEIPTEPHDVVMNYVLTPARWLSCGRAFVAS